MSVSLVVQSWSLIYNYGVGTACVDDYSCRYVPIVYKSLLSQDKGQPLAEIVVSNSNVNRNENFSSLTTKEKKVEQFNNNFENSNIGNFANQALDNARLQSRQENYVYEQTQDLALAAEHIQKLLNQLEKDNPAATEIEKVSYVTEKTDASFKRRFIKALAAGGESALEEYLVDTSYVRIIRSMVSAWIGAN